VCEHVEIERKFDAEPTVPFADLGALPGRRRDFGAGAAPSTRPTSNTGTLTCSAQASPCAAEPAIPMRAGTSHRRPVPVTGLNTGLRGATRPAATTPFRHRCSTWRGPGSAITTYTR